MNNNKIRNLKISSFFNSFDLKGKPKSKRGKVTKTASNYLRNAVSPEELEKRAKIFSNIIRTGDFNDLKLKLKEAVGLVDLITDGQDLLAEVLIKDTFPPNSNDIYGMGMDTIEGDYSIDARYTFKNARNPGEAEEQLGEVLFGSPEVMDRAWLKTIASSDAGVKQIIEDLSSDAFDLGAVIDAYEQTLENMAKWKRKLNDNTEQRKELKATIERTKEIINSKEIAETQKNALREQLGSLEGQLEEMRQSFINTRALYGRIANSAKQQARGLNPSDYFEGRPLHKKDGFLDFDPITDIENAKKDLLDAIKQKGKGSDLDEIKIQVAKLINLLKQYKTTDKVLLKKRDQLFKFFGVDIDEYDEASEEKQGELIDAAARKCRSDQRFVWLRNQQEFSDRASQHGKLMVIKNFENSIFCTPPRPGTDSPNATLAAPTTLHKFNVLNRKGFTGTGSEGSKKLGNRAIIIFSHHPINGLEATKVDLSTVPVTSAQASIIVDELLGAYSKKSLEFASLAALSRASTEGENLPNEERKAKIHQAYQETMANKAIIGGLSLEAKDRLKQLLIGLTQDKAIDLVESSLRGGLDIQTDEEDNIISLNFDSKRVVNVGEKRLNEIAQDIGFGFTPDEPSVRFTEYAYKKSSEWADKVESVGGKAKELAYLRSCIVNREIEISRLRAELVSGKSMDGKKLSAKTKEEKTQRVQELTAEIENKRSQISSIKIHLPHLCLLYGPPGVGKSIWADAMGDLFGCTVRNVDLSSSKSKWYGETEQQTQKLFTSMLASQNTVFLLDELDRMIGMSGQGGQPTGGGGSGGEHQVDRAVVKQMLDLFENPSNFAKMLEHNIFIVITTNYLANIDTAMMSRIEQKGGAFEVELPDDPEAYKKLLMNFLNVERRRFPDYPMLCPRNIEVDEKGIPIGGGVDVCWEFTFKKLQEMGTPTAPGHPSSLDVICSELASKKIDFRLTKTLFQEIWSAHQDYENSMAAIGRGDADLPLGLPMTLPNIIASIKEAVVAIEGHDKSSNGVSKIRTRRREEIEDAMQGVELPTEEFYDEETKQNKQRVNLNSLPQVVEIMNGSMEEEVIDQVDIEEEITEHPETGEKKSYPVIKMSPQEEMEKMRDEVFEEPAVEPGKQKTEQKGKEKAPQEENKTEDVVSSTDYLFNYLKKEGLVSQEGKFISKEKIAQAQLAQEQTEQDLGNGVYWFENGLLVAPGSPNAPAQYLTSEIEKQKNKKGI